MAEKLLNDDVFIDVPYGLEEQSIDALGLEMHDIFSFVAIARGLPLGCVPQTAEIVALNGRVRMDWK